MFASSGSASAAGVPGTNLLEMADTIRTFLCRHPTARLREGGRVVARLDAEQAGFSITTESGRLVCHFWSAEANLVRRVVRVVDEGKPRLRLDCLRLGRSQTEPLVIEAAAEAMRPAERRREEFRQTVESAIQREWHGWQVESGPWSAAASRSPVQKLLLRRGGSLIACVAVAEEETPAAAAQALGHALAWTEQVREGWPLAPIRAVRLIVPPQAEVRLAERSRWLLAPPLAPPIEFYRLDRSAGQLDPSSPTDEGNIASQLRRAPSTNVQTQSLAAESERLLGEIREFCPAATLETSTNGLLLFRHYGLEFAREASAADALAAAFTFGLGAESTPLTEANRPLFGRLLRQLGSERVPTGDRRSWLFGLQPERWLEHLLRSDPAVLDPALVHEVYPQVPVCEGGERDLLDLLAMDRHGRLHVLELKASEHIGFPLQALDYWSRVRRHQLAGDFERLGYFPGRMVSPLPPRLCLIAPALRWHPRTDAILKWLRPEVPWLCIGINEEWRRGIQVVYRKEAPSV